MSNQASGVTIWPPGWPGDLARTTDERGHVPSCTELADALIDHAPDDAKCQAVAYFLKRRAETRALLDVTKDAEQRGKLKAQLVMIGRQLKALGLDDPAIRRAKP